MKQPKEVLKTYFETGDKPTQQQFSDLIDSYHHLDSGATVTNVVENEDGNQSVSLSNGNTITVFDPVNNKTQNNKIRVVDLGVLSISLLEDPMDTVARAVNNLNPPLIVRDDENIIFEYDFQIPVNDERLIESTKR